MLTGLTSTVIGSSNLWLVLQLASNGVAGDTLQMSGRLQIASNFFFFVFVNPAKGPSTQEKEPAHTGKTAEVERRPHKWERSTNKWEEITLNLSRNYFNGPTDTLPSILNVFVTSLEMFNG